MAELYNKKFCQFMKCKHRHGNECELEKCIYNHKRIVYWEKHGVWPSES